MLWKKREVTFVSPVKGKIIPLSDTPDEAFANNKFGNGFSIIPEGNKIIAPTDGTVMFIFDTNHAIGIRTTNNVEYIIHIGIDTHKLKGKGFKCFTSAEKKVKKGDLLIEFDLDFIKENNFSTIIPLVFTNIDEDCITVINNDEVEQGEEIFIIRK